MGNLLPSFAEPYSYEVPLLGSPGLPGATVWSLPVSPYVSQQKPIKSCSGLEPDIPFNTSLFSLPLPRPASQAPRAHVTPSQTS